MKTIILLFQIFTVILFYGCSTSDTSDGILLTGTEWVMFEMDGVKYENASGKNVTIMFDGKTKKMSGKAPCNTYGSTYVKKNNKLSFRNIFTTEMACGELDVESAYYKLLPKVFAYQISGDKLYLFDSGGMAIVRFKEK